jgi:HTH-type transcriptional regulator/antitoxin HigA
MRLMPRRCEVVQVRPIKTNADYEAALARAETLMDAEPNTSEADELDVLATLIEAYEDKHFPMDLPDPVDAIKFHIEQQGLSRKDLEPLIGSRARVAEVLNRRRGLSLAMVRRLNAELGIPAEVLIQGRTRAPRHARNSGRRVASIRNRA